MIICLSSFQCVEVHLHVEWDKPWATIECQLQVVGVHDIGHSKTILAIFVCHWSPIVVNHGPVCLLWQERLGRVHCCYLFKFSLVQVWPYLLHITKSIYVLKPLIALACFDMVNHIGWLHLIFHHSFIIVFILYIFSILI